jgi:hypothetical protein
VHYRDWGFTLDLIDREYLINMLNEPVWNTFLRNVEIDLARYYIYFRFFRQIVRIPFLSRIRTEYKSLPSFENLLFLHEGKDNFMDTLVDRIVDGNPIVDIPRHTSAKWSNISQI